MRKVLSSCVLAMVVGCTQPAPPSKAPDLATAPPDLASADLSVPPDLGSPADLAEPIAPCWIEPDTTGYIDPPAIGFQASALWDIVTPFGANFVGQTDEVIAKVDIFNRAGETGSEHTLEGTYLPFRIAATFSLSGEVKVYKDDPVLVNRLSTCKVEGHPNPGNFILYLDIRKLYVADAAMRMVVVTANTNNAGSGKILAVAVEGPLLYEEGARKLKTSKDLPTVWKTMSYQ